MKASPSIMENAAGSKKYIYRSVIDKKKKNKAEESSKNKNTLDCSMDPNSPLCCHIESTPEGYEKSQQKLLDSVASCYRQSIHYGPDQEVRTCIMPGDKSISWKEKSSGVSWIGVKGSAGHIVMSMHEDMLPTQSTGRSQLSAYSVLRTAISDVGGASSGSIRSKVARWSKSKGPFAVGPFAVVSVAPGTVEDSGASAAINFLKKKLKDGPSLGTEKTLQVAILALKYLFGSRFKLSVPYASILEVSCGEVVKFMVEKGDYVRVFKDAYLCGLREEGETPEEDG